MKRRSLLSRAITLAALNAYWQTAKSAAEVEVSLQDPLPGKAIIYLLRIPSDSAQVEVLLDEKAVASLPPGKYSVVSAAPGSHELSGSTGKEVMPPTPLEVKEGERRFFYVSGTSANSLGVSSSYFPFFGALAGAIGRTGTVDGTRSWKECVELDARGLMSVSSLILPRQDAL